MRGLVHKFDRNVDWTKGQRTLSTTEAKIRNYWKSCDHRVPLFPAADPDPWPHPETLASFWGWEQRMQPPKSSPAAGQGWRDGSLAEEWTHSEGNFWRLDLQVAGTAVSCFIYFLSHIWSPMGKWDLLWSLPKFFLEKPCNSGISLKTPH